MVVRVGMQVLQGSDIGEEGNWVAGMAADARDDERE